MHVEDKSDDRILRPIYSVIKLSSDLRLMDGQSRAADPSIIACMYKRRPLTEGNLAERIIMHALRN